MNKNIFEIHIQNVTIYVNEAQDSIIKRFCCSDEEYLDDEEDEDEDDFEKGFIGRILC